MIVNVKSTLRMILTLRYSLAGDIAHHKEVDGKWFFVSITSKSMLHSGNNSQGSKPAKILQYAGPPDKTMLLLLNPVPPTLTVNQLLTI